MRVLCSHNDLANVNFIKWGNMSIYTIIRIYVSICTHRRKNYEVAMAVSYSVSESAGMMERRARDNSYTPYELAGMIESDQMRVLDSFRIVTRKE